MATAGFSVTSQSLGKLRSLSQDGSLPVKYVYGNGDQECKTSENRRRVFQRVLLANVLINFEDTRELAKLGFMIIRTTHAVWRIMQLYPQADPWRVHFHQWLKPSMARS